MNGGLRGTMNKIITAVILVIIILIATWSNIDILERSPDADDESRVRYKEVSDTIKKGETLFDIASSIVKCNTWESRLRVGILSGHGKEL